MGRPMIVGLVLAMAVTAMAGGNPYLRLYVDFDPPNYVHTIEPELYTTFYAYVCVDCLGDEASGGGISGLFFRVDLTDGLSGWAAYSPMVPIHLPITWPELDGDIPMIMVDCLLEGPCPVLQVQLFWLGVPGCVKVGDHNELPREVWDCDWELDHYCVYTDGSVGGGECPPGDPGCDCSGTPIQDGTWGSMKALYR